MQLNLMSNFVSNLGTAPQGRGIELSLLDPAFRFVGFDRRVQQGDICVVAGNVFFLCRQPVQPANVHLCTLHLWAAEHLHQESTIAGPAFHHDHAVTQGAL